MNEAEALTSSTGDARVDQILSALDRIDDVPVPDRAGLFLDVHERLSSALTPEQKVREAGAHGAA